MSYATDMTGALISRLRIFGGQLDKNTKAMEQSNGLEETVKIQAQTIAKLIVENGELRAIIAGKTNDAQSIQQGIAYGKRMRTMSTTPTTTFTVRQPGNLLGQ